MNIRKFSVFSISLILVGVISLFNAQAAEVKIAVVDLNKVRTESVAFKNAINKINGRVQELQEKAKEVEHEFAKKQEDLIKKQNVLSADIYNKQSQELATYAEKKEKEFYEKRMAIDKDFNTVNEKFHTKMNSIIESIAKKRSITAVFEKNIMFFSDSSIEITKEVIEKLNNELKVIEVN